MVRAAAVLVAALGLAGCEADIGSGVYYCGYEEACPPDLACDEQTNICVFPNQARPFDCLAGANDFEPDDQLDDAGDFGVGGCGAVSINERGCVDTADDVDHSAFTTPLSCDGELEIEVRYPVAFQPLAFDILDEAGEVLDTAELCRDLDENGEAKLCAAAEVSADQRIVVRVTAEPGGPDCDGACAYNRYQLSIF